uniref:L-dopachrome isomerase n=1 Tax=Pyramimonas obovata TaxID=1411642 RepID=A0A7S0N2H9_9CHLO|mmetsp:Transcript_17505/g.38150  ORF Transcript_17505/g.38150 Transcript_17505/m.38150 type:complete len:124 (+) Transcript_17505:93-464(+)|eukprot:CAMPEP_0118924896 /NCGR_PEP_ID=MMETSP1169-20130426/2828_1 /TAXON_ID=36882 /ORGANISM="Pyramimonas obovata, Strain CCMP722" /LENGTH=123 /DNA_ID=CAMNT_0006866039 /DNA_START=88 /DNA_END=459 /DNA_ORIENTATION=-
MPTVQVASNVEVADKATLVKLIEEMTDILAPAAKVPREYVHIHVMPGQTMSFGADHTTPLCQVSVMVCEGQLDVWTKNTVAKELCEPLKKAFAGLGAERTQVVFPTLTFIQIAIGGALLGDNC